MFHMERMDATVATLRFHVTSIYAVSLDRDFTTQTYSKMCYTRVLLPAPDAAKIRKPILDTE